MQGTQAIKSKRFRLVETLEYGVDLEYNDDLAILHIPYVSKFNKTILSDMLIKLDELGDFISCVGYSRIHLGIPETNSKTLKLASRLGFEHVGDSQGFCIYEKWVGEE